MISNKSRGILIQGLVEIFFKDIINPKIFYILSDPRRAECPEIQEDKVA